MTERERMIELLKGAETKVSETLSRPLALDERLGMYADHLLSNGAIAPPCKVGDTVWDRSGDPHKVVSIEWYSKKVVHLHCEHHTFSIGKRSIGKTVFLAGEEAEQALKERNEK